MKDKAKLRKEVGAVGLCIQKVHDAISRLLCYHEES